MPHGNKNSTSRRTNRKRKDEVAPSDSLSGNSGGNDAQSPPPARAYIGRTSTHNVRVVDDVPPLPSFLSAAGSADEKARAQTKGNIRNSLYFSYKASTQRFKDALFAMTPSSLTRSVGPRAIIEATDYVAEHGIGVEHSLLSDLKASIRNRRKVALFNFAGGDDAHAHFISILEYSWSILAPRRKQQTGIANKSKKKSELDSVRNRFEQLSTETERGDGDDVSDSEKDEDDDELDMPQTPQPRPEDLGNTDSTLEEAISGTGRTNVILFLMTLNDLMGCTAQLYRKLKETASWLQKEKYPPIMAIGQLMEASVAADLAIREVAYLEEVFTQEHPHLNTMYRMFATLMFCEITQHLTSIVMQKSPLASEFSETYAIELLGDAIEYPNRCPSDPYNKFETMVPDFLQRWQFSDEAAPEDLMSVQRIVSVTQSMAEDDFQLNHTWLNDEYIGANRSIMHTIFLVQAWADVATSRGRVAFNKGLFGEAWNDRKEPATRIQIDMDELLMFDIMQPLVNRCCEGFVSKTNQPYLEELCFGFVEIRKFIEHPERPLSWTVAFVVHSILTAIFEVQGSDRMTFLADTAQEAFTTFARQLRMADMERRDAEVWWPPTMCENIETLLGLGSFLTFTRTERTPEQTKHSCWNPYCAGVILSYLTFYGNFMGGTSFLGCFHELSMTLHLFNALKQVRAIKLGDIDLLDRVFKIFERTTSIWGGQLRQFPVQGQFQARWEMTLRAAEATPSNIWSHLELDRLSRSYTRICLQDFRSTAATSQGKKQSKHQEPLHRFVEHVNDTLEAMTRDEQLLAMNLPSLSIYLNRFCLELFKDFGWMSILEQDIERTENLRPGFDSLEEQYERSRYAGMVHVFSFPMEHLDKGTPGLASRCASFMKRFFRKLRPDKIMWFTPNPI